MQSDTYPIKSDDASKERRLAAALQASEIGVFEFEPQTNLAFWDDRVRELWGIPAGEKITYETVIAQVHEDDRELHDVSTQKALDPQGLGEMDMEYRVIPRNGEPMRWLRAKATCSFEDGVPVRLLGTVQDITERRVYLERNELLINELQHRAKNTLATVISIMNLSKAGYTNIDDYTSALEDRLISMAQIHNILSKNDWKGVGLEDILKREFDAFTTPAQGAYSFKGPNLHVPAQNVQIMAMAIHELLTNAVKHGSLSVPNGKVTIRTAHDDGHAVFHWEETGGPEFAEMVISEGGFGSFLLTQILGAELGATIDYALKTTGVVFHMKFPAKSEAAP